MFKVINEYLSKVNLKANDEINIMLADCLSGNPMIKKYTVTNNFLHYVLDIKLDEYSVENAVRVFNEINACIAYPYSSIHLRFNEGKCVRYRYVTSKENKDAFYCDIIFS